MIDYSLIPNFLLKDPETEINAIKYTFEPTKNAGNYFKPFMVIFETPSQKDMVVTSRDIVDEEDYLVALNEMCSLFPSLDSQTMILALDVTKTTPTGEQDCLEIFIASDTVCIVVHLPYKIENQVLIWQDDQSKLFEIDNINDLYKSDSKNEISLNVLEIVYLNTHMETTTFEASRLMHFAQTVGYNFAAVSERAKASNNLY